MTTALAPAEWKNRAAGWVTVAQDTEIQGPGDYQQAAEDLQTIKSLEAEAESYFNPIIARAFEAHREACAQKKRALEPLTQAEALLKQKVRVWLEAIESLRRQQEDLLRQEAEREALEAREREIEAAESLGADAEELAAIAQAPIERRPVVTQPAAPKIAGLTARETWHAEVKDLHALIVYVAQHREYTGLLQANMTAINGIVRSLRAACNLPGIRVYREKQIGAMKR